MRVRARPDLPLIGGWFAAIAGAQPAVDPALAEAAEPAAPSAWWAGRFVTAGARRVPVLGSVAYRTETLTLAEARPTVDGWLLSQRTCAVTFEKAAGARVSMAPTGPAGMPPSTLRVVQSDDAVHIEPWTSGWGDGDLDVDGRPGITIHVDAPLCAGSIMVASAARSTATEVRAHERGYEGEVAIWTEQTLLDARGLCLSMFARSSEETMRGRFRYAPVPATRCEEVDWSTVPPVEAVAP